MRFVNASRIRVGEEMLCSSFFFGMVHLALQQKRGLRCGLSNVLCSSVVVLCSLRSKMHIASADQQNVFSPWNDRSCPRAGCKVFGLRDLLFETFLVCPYAARLARRASSQHEIPHCVEAPVESCDAKFRSNSQAKSPRAKNNTNLDMRTRHPYSISILHRLQK